MPNHPTLSDRLKNIDVCSELSQFSSFMDARTSSLSQSQTRTRIPRKPRKGNEIALSIYRPHVVAGERLLKWTSPHTQIFRENMSKALPESHLTRLFEVMAFSLDQSTRDGYASGLLRFTQYCDNINIPEVDRMPASEPLLASFIAFHAGKVASSTIDNWLAGLHFWHTINGAQWNGGDILSRAKKGAQKLVPISSKRAKRPPVTIEHLYALRNGLDLSNAFDAAVWSIACIAFWCCCRLGGLVIPSTNLFDPIKHVARSTSLAFHTLPNSTEYGTCQIPWTKTTLREGATISITARDDPSCPIKALKHHLSCSKSIPSHAPLFSFETADGGWSPMTKGWFMAQCNDVWVASGLPDMPGHGFRIGGATHLLLMGVAPDLVAAQGRWKSRAFMDYWRKIESILPLFMSSTGSASRVSIIEESMSAYRKKWKL
jgi:hypothetical protein